jgi:hypothetical protein
MSNIDFYQRELFFKYMRDFSCDINYDDFFLVEIVNSNTEKIISKKIIALKYKNRITYLFFKDSKKCNSKGNFSDFQVKMYKYESLEDGIRNYGNEYVIVTKITGNKY